ncbi:MAG: hypothetical protein ABGW75_03400, partial [Pirellulales bacterium]
MTQATHTNTPLMRNRFQAFLLVILPLNIVLFAPKVVNAQHQQWGHWRGPTGNGTSLTAKPPTEFGPDKNCRWKQAIPGRGSSSPVIWNQQ